MAKRLVILAVLLIGLRCAAPVRAADVNKIIDGWLANQTNIQSWASDFTQTRKVRSLTQPLVSTGQVWFAAPQNFRWQVGSNQTIAIRNEDAMLVVYPRLKRAERYDFSAAGATQWKDTLQLLQSGFPRSRENLEQQFQVLSATRTNALWSLDLQPRNQAARAMMPVIRLLLSTNFTLAGTELVFADGSSMRNDFTNSRTNADTAGKFDLTIPPGWRVVEPFQSAR